MSNNKLALITGANIGIGLATAQALAAQGFDLILWCRNEAKGREAQQLIQQKSPSVKVDLLVANLGDLAATRQAAQQIAATYPKLDALVNNAGFIPDATIFNKWGIEECLYASHFGHYVLTMELLPLLEKAEDPRIVNVSSDAHKVGNAERLFKQHNSNKVSTYGDAKLANILFTMGLRNLPNSKIKAYCLHPGVVNTNFGQNAGRFFRFLVSLARPFMITPEKGAATSIYLASTPTAQIPNELYFVKCKPQKVGNKTITTENAAKLWTKSQEVAASI